MLTNLTEFEKKFLPILKVEKSTVTSFEPVKVAIIHTVQPKSPSDVAGLKSGERILSINGYPVTGQNYEDIVQRVQSR